MLDRPEKLAKHVIEPAKFFLLTTVQPNLDYSDSLGLDKIVRIIGGPDNQK